MHSYRSLLSPLLNVIEGRPFLLFRLRTKFNMSRVVVQSEVTSVARYFMEAQTTTQWSSSRRERACHSAEAIEISLVRDSDYPATDVRKGRIGRYCQQ